MCINENRYQINNYKRVYLFKHPFISENRGIEGSVRKSSRYGPSGWYLDGETGSWGFRPSYVLLFGHRSIET